MLLPSFLPCMFVAICHVRYSRERCPGRVRIHYRNCSQFQRSVECIIASIRERYPSHLWKLVRDPKNKAL